MKKKIILTMIVSLFLAAGMNAQTAKPNFAGEWSLDADKSKLPDAAQIESMKLRVLQNEQELRIITVTKLPPSEARRGAPRAAVSGTQTAVYNLEGKETTADIGSGIMEGREARRATATADGKLNLTTSRSFTSEMGGAATKTNEIWELLDEGKTLKVTRYMESPNGAVNAEMFFTRKTPVPALMTRNVEGPGGAISQDQVAVGGSENGVRKISGGVLNGKAVSLPKPAYPAAARAVQASGAVNVQVTIDEQGNIVSASAVSGHPLLRQAAEKAAREAKFAPVMLSGVPVSVTGVLVYNFVP